MTLTKNQTDLKRRQFLKTGAALGGGLILSMKMPSAIPGAMANETMDDFAPNAFIRIDKTGKVSLIMPAAEMGQGTHMAHTMILAEELDIELDQIVTEASPPDDKLYGNPGLGGQQTTGLSTSIRAFWDILRNAGATARILLVNAAAQKWDVDPASCYTKSGAVFDATGDRKLKYGELVETAATLPTPEKVKLKNANDFKLIGKATKRLDTPKKVNGQARYGIDFTLPDLKFAAIAISPVFGGRPKNINKDAALSVQGVKQIVETSEAVAVIANHYWAARQGLDEADIEWDDGVNANVNSEQIAQELNDASQQSGAVARSEGDALNVIANATNRIDAIYEVPFLAHAPMEPINYTVHVQKDSCDIWGGTQVPTAAQRIGAELTGLPLEAVRIHNFPMGGAFGRRLEVDAVAHAIEIARQVDGPVKVIWSREEDIQHQMYRPTYLDRISAATDDAGKLQAWSHRISGSSILSRVAPPLVQNGVDFDGVEAAANAPYHFDAIHVEFQRVEPPAVPTSFWRGVGATHNVFVVESFLDELATASQTDPMLYRQELLRDNKRALNVLNLAAEKSEWIEPLVPQQGIKQGRGIAVQHAFGSYLAAVAEVEFNSDDELRVTRVIVAVDCGININPDTIAAQIEGGALFGLTAALYGEITIEDGRVEQSNFHDYLPLRMDEAPHIDTYIVKSDDAPGGIGEAATAIIAPAVTNAIFNATGKRIRKLPIATAI